MSWKTFVAGGGGYTRGARGWTVVVATAVSGGSKSGWEVWRLQNGWWAAGRRRVPGYITRKVWHGHPACVASEL